MFKVLVVLVIGAFIASQAKPYHRQYLEERLQKREAEEVYLDIVSISNELIS